jgi:hypothetical protein
MGSICYTEIKARWQGSSTARMDMLVELEKRGIVKSSMYNHMGHGFERVWTSV